LSPRRRRVGWFVVMGGPTTGQASGPSMRPRSGHEVKGSGGDSSGNLQCRRVLGNGPELCGPALAGGRAGVMRNQEERVA
jgi:hypothetical protein